ncbi:MAG: F0F1 ATP synthase subunit alpha, partial [Chthonomonadales bacterium]
GVRPAINVGISVSRVGGNAQIKAMKSVAGKLKLDLAQYREVQAFAQFASDLDKTTQNQLQRGARMVELLKQPQFQPMPVATQVITIFAGMSGFLDDLPIADVRRFETDLFAFLTEKYPEIDETIRLSGALTDDTQATLKQAITEFKSGFKTSA